MIGYLVIFYAVAILAFLIYSIAGIYHLWRFGYSGDLSKVIIFCYSTLSLTIIIVSAVILSIRIALE